MTALAGGARLALRIPLLASVFPDARFVFLAREPAEAAAEMLAVWRSGRGSPFPTSRAGTARWSLPLVPGWRRLSGEPLEAVVAEQWRAIAETALDDLEALDPERWCVADHGALCRPAGELRRLCEFSGSAYDQALLAPLEEARARRTVSPAPARARKRPAPPAPVAVPQRPHRLASARRLHELGARCSSRPTRPASSSARARATAR